MRNWSRRTLEKASDRVADVQGDDDDDEVEEDPVPAPKEESSTGDDTHAIESRKTQ